jgi:hypothetical protein
LEKVGGFTFNSSQPLRLIFSVVILVLLLAPTAVAQETSGAPGSLDAVLSSILKQNLVRVPKEPEDTVVDLDRTRRILELTRQVVLMQRAVMRRDQDPSSEARAALAKDEAEMFQADLDYRAAYAELKHAAGEQ